MCQSMSVPMVNPAFQEPAPLRPRGILTHHPIDGGRARSPRDALEHRHPSDIAPGDPVAIGYSIAFDYISSVKDIAYSRTAQKALTRMPRNRAERIRSKLRAYATDPASQARTHC